MLMMSTPRNPDTERGGQGHTILQKVGGRDEWLFWQAVWLIQVLPERKRICPTSTVNITLNGNKVKD